MTPLLQRQDSVVPINSSPLTITLYTSVKKTLVCNDTNIQSPSSRYKQVRLYIILNLWQLRKSVI
jgi:hypothetical protein